MKRIALFLGLFLAPICAWGAFNEPQVGSISVSQLGAGVWSALQNTLDLTGGLVSYSNLATDGAAAGFLTSGGALGTPSSGVMTNLTGTPAGLGLANATGTPSSIGLANGTGLPIAGTTGWGTGVASALGNALDAASGLVSYSSLASDVKTVLSMSASVATAIQNATNAASGLVQVTAGGYEPYLDKVGTATNNNAVTGNIGEFQSSDVPSASNVGLSSTVSANVTSLALTAGDWECWGNVQFNTGGTTVTTNIIAWTSTTSAAFPGATETTGMTRLYTPATAGISFGIGVAPIRYSLASTTTVYLEAYSQFATSTSAAYGRLECRRAR